MSATQAICKYYWLIALICLSKQVQGQDQAGFVDTLISNQSTFIELEQKFVIPSSIDVQWKNMEQRTPIPFRLSNDTLFINAEKKEGKDQFKISYRYLNAPLFQDEKLLDSTLIAKNPQNYFDLTIDDTASENRNLENRALNYSGSFARGFSIGNRQDLVLNSDLDLQLNGKIGGEIDILAAISDQNIPLEPEGNTQNLREFDKVFIQLSKDKHRLLIGDYEIQSDSSHFLNFFKKWQGLRYDDEFAFDHGGTLHTTGATAIARGNYHRNILSIQEGNQGPYLLQGANGENFIIVVAATERVYLDGVLLTRGIEKDYIIDYNTAEITFTPNLLITKDVRITVDFEYNNQRYLRTGSFLKGNYTKGKTKVYGSFYNEQDSRNTSGSNSIDLRQKQQLAAIGDNLDNAFGSSINPLQEEDLDPITYRLTDTTINQITYDSILVYSISNELDLFTAQFTFVGTNKGSYIIRPGTSNGSIYEWVPPIEGILQGDYAPIIQLAGPLKTAMFTIGVDHQIKDKWKIGTEIAATNQDLNRFSNLDNDDNRGISTLSFIDYSSSKDSTHLNLDAGLKFEFIHQNFASINPFRNAEFNRDWNLEAGAENVQQLLADGYLNISKSDFLRLNIHSEFLDNATGVRGYRQSADVYLTHKGLTITAQPSFLKSNSQTEESTFWRPNFDVYQMIGKKDLRLGVKSLIEQNIRKVNLDSLSNLSFSFSRYEAYLENSTSKRLHTRISLAQRIDKLPNENTMDLASTAHELYVKGHWNRKKTQQLNWNLIARNLKVNNQDLLDEVDLQTYLGKLSYTFQLFKGVIRSSTAYELGSGQENKRSFVYIEVEPGKGIYQWIDYNDDTIQQIEEFELAPNLDQATYIRIERPSNEFIKTQNVLFNQNLQLGLKPIWFNQKGLKKLVGKFSSTSNIQISRKNNENANFDFWNPFDLSFKNEGIVTAQSLIRNNLYYDRGSPKFAAYIGRSNTLSAQTLDFGSLRNRQIQNYLNYQFRITKSINHTLDILTGSRINEASLFENRNFDLETWRINPAIHFLFSNTLNMTVQYANERLDNSIGESEQLTKDEFNLSLGYQKSASRSIDLGVTYSNIVFDGPLNTPVAFTMLNGLQNGRNLEWQLTMNQQIAKNLQLLFNYNGRKTGSLNIVHFGNLQVKATF